MTILTVDSGTSFRLNNLADLTEIRDESGRVLGYFHPVSSTTGSGADAHRSPFTVDELRKRRQQRTGKPVSKLLAELQGSPATKQYLADTADLLAAENELGLGLQQAD